MNKFNIKILGYLIKDRIYITVFIDLLKRVQSNFVPPRNHTTLRYFPLASQENVWGSVQPDCESLSTLRWIESYNSLL